MLEGGAYGNSNPSNPSGNVRGAVEPIERRRSARALGGYRVDLLYCSGAAYYHSLAAEQHSADTTGAAGSAPSAAMKGRSA